MIQFNLLPDVKLQFIKAQRRKRLVMTVSFVVTAVSVLIFASLLSYVRIGQKSQLSDLSKQITDSTKKLEGTTDLDKILTIQNQLKSLPALHDQKVISSRLFDYLKLLTPAQATISNVDIDFTANTLNIKGNADALSTVNKYADTLKFTQLLQHDSQGKITKTNAFKAVVLQSFSITQSAAVTDATKQVSYQLSFSFDPLIFANTKGAAAPDLNVPKIITTRSEVEKPGSLFAPQPQVTGTGDNNGR
jgi:Tfp pilus assembly protein PilN